jgi:hypothetical protein
VEVAAEERRLTAIAVSVACGRRSFKAAVYHKAFVKCPRRPREVAHDATRWRGLDGRTHKVMLTVPIVVGPLKLRKEMEADRWLDTTSWIEASPAKTTLQRTAAK